MKLHSLNNIIEICKMVAISIQIALIALFQNANGLINQWTQIQMVIVEVQFHRNMHIHFSTCFFAKIL
jgi:hypothetical protein